jgi:tripartite-type tricarboxylate transporter receptor subunit TctC
MKVIESSRRNLLKATMAVAGVAALPAGPRAEGFPSQPIKLICPFAPGPSVDALMRAMAESVRQTLGGAVVVENKPGAGGTLGAIEVAAARPDGYTLTELPDAFFIVPQMQKVPFNPLKDFTYIACLFGTVYGLAVLSSSPLKNMKDVVDYARANPGKFTYSTAGIGTMNHLIMEGFAQRLGLEWVHVPYKGATPATMAVLSGEVMATSGTTAWAPFVDNGQFRLIATYGSSRTARWPDVPTLQELGYGVVADGPAGFAGPKGMDPQIVQRLHDAFKLSLGSPAVKAILELNSTPILYRDGAGYAELAARMYAEAGSLIRSLGLQIKDT